MSDRWIGVNNEAKRCNPSYHVPKIRKKPRREREKSRQISQKRNVVPENRSRLERRSVA